MLKVEELGASLEGKLTRLDLAEFEHEYFGANYKLGLFRQLTVYIDKPPASASVVVDFEPLDLVETTLKFYGASVAQSLNNPGLTHVIVRESDVTRIEDFKSVRYLL